MILQKIVGETDEIRQISGSQCFDGKVPKVNWNGWNGNMNVNYYAPSNANDNLRSRQKFPETPPRRGFSSQIFNPAIGHFRNFLKVCFQIYVNFVFNDVYFFGQPE